MDKIHIAEKFSHISEHWRPKIVAQINGQEVKLVKFKGEFVWHYHNDADELFFAWRGSFRIEFRDRTVQLNEGECMVVPRGVEHRTVADNEVEVILFEPANTRNTGNIEHDRLTAPQHDVI